MRYLRMLSNSAFAGLLAAVYLTLLLLLLNPAVPLENEAVLPLLVVITATYGIHIFVVSYVLYVLRQIALGEPASPGWISLRLLTWSAAALSGTAAIITWLHGARLGNTLPPPAIEALTRAAIAFAASAAAFLLLGIAQAATQHGRRATVAILFTLATIGSMAAPLIVRGPAPRVPRVALPPPPPGDGIRGEGPRLVLLCLEGASLDVISPAVAAGRLPNFGRILDRGASMHVATTRPTQPEPAWASVVTGQWPAVHGVRAAARYRPYNGGSSLEILPDYLFSQALVRFGFLVEEAHTSRSLQVRPLWRILAMQGLRAGVIGLPLTYPADPTAGFIVSDRFHRRAGRLTELDPQPAVYPPALEEAARGVLVEGDEPLPPFRARLDTPAPLDDADTLAADRLHHRLAMRLGPAEGVRLLAVRYAGLDAIGHYYLRYTQPSDFDDVSDEERRLYGRVLDDYYAYVDSLVGELAALLRDGDVLVIVSAFGMEPLTVGKRMLERLLGDDRFSGTHERAPDGFVMAYGAPVAPGRLPRGAVVDVVPTLLYFLGLPVARDMPGFARTDMFTAAFNAPRTLTFIPTYE